MDEKPKSIWKKSWKGPRAFLFWLLVVSIAAFVGAVTVTMTTFGSTPLFDRHRGLENFVGCTLVVMLVFIATVAVAFIFYGVVRWLFCWSNLKRTFFATVCLITLIALAYAEEDWRGWHAWNQFKHEWEAKGEKLDYANIIPPAVPDEQNFALTPVIASCYEMYFDKNGHKVEPRNTNVVNRLSILSWSDISYENQREKVPDSAGWRAAQKMDLKAWQAFFRSPPPTNSILTNSFPIAPQPQTPADDVLLALSKDDSVIEEIRQTSRLPYSRFPLTYESEDSFSILLPHLAALKMSSRDVWLRSVAELQKNRTELAAEDVRLGLYLANAIRTEAFPISQLVRLSMLENALQPVWEGLAEHRWSEPQLVAMDEELAKLDFLADSQKAQKAEIFFSAEEANYLRRHRDYATQFAQMGFVYPKDARFKFAIYRYMPGGWFYQSALKNGRTLMEYSTAVNRDSGTISPAIIRQADASASNGVSFFDPLDSLKKMFNAEFLWTGNFLKQIAAGQTYVNLARTAIALERHRLARGEFPESLDALAPQFIAAVPHDVIGGGPLKYRREANGQFVLYSVGWNETDDGGVVVNQKSRDPRDESSSKVDISQGDWVWRYPAK
jgi:hypothetical protein